MRHVARLSLAALAAAAIVACGGTPSEKDTGAAPTTAPAPTTAAPKAAPTTKAAITCAPASKALLAAIVAGAQGGTGMKAMRGVTWRSPDYAKVWFVGMEFSATGVPNQIGVWASNSLSGEGLILAVDGFAQQFTDWSHADNTDAKISGADPGVEIVKTCLGA